MIGFKNFINEIRDENLENVDLNRDLLFNHIFNDKLRILIPLESTDGEIAQLIRTIEMIGSIKYLATPGSLGYEIVYQDLLDKKIVYKIIKTKEGIKKRPEKVGRVLQDAIKKCQKQNFHYLTDRIKMNLDWWQKNGSDLKNSKTGASIIISRSPIDLVRMSDHDNISSCHGPSGSFFKCAKQEARTGGAIAYVVKNSDLKGLDIQKPEIFKDKHRNIDGIVPLERLRLRRFLGMSTEPSINNLDILVPELKTYGTKNIGFYNQVKQWAIDSQKEIIEKIDPENNYEDFHLKGGSYQDSDAQEIWGEFFNKIVRGDKESLDSSEEENDSESLFDAAEHQINDHARSWKHFDLRHDVYDNDILDYTAYCVIGIPKKLFKVNFSDNFQNKNEYNTYRQIKKTIEENIDIYAISDINIGSDRNKYFFNIDVVNEDPYNYNNQLTRLEHFLDYIDGIDKEFDTHVSKVYKALLDENFIKSMSEKLTFKNFEIEEDDYEGSTIQSKPEKIFYLNQYPIVEDGELIYNNKPIYKDKEKLYINKFRNKFFNSIDFKNLKIFPFVDNPKNFRLYLLDGGTTRVDKDDVNSHRAAGDPNLKVVKRITGWVYFEFEKTLGFDITSNTKNIQLLKHLDNNWDFYIKKLAKFFESYVKMETQRFKPPLISAKEEAPDFSFNKKKDYPEKPSILKTKEKQLNFKSFVDDK